MCRRNWFHGWLMIAFGAGVLLGTLVDSGLLLFLIGLGTLAWGFCLMQK